MNLTGTIEYMLFIDCLGGKLCDWLIMRGWIDSFADLSEIFEI